MRIDGVKGSWFVVPVVAVSAVLGGCGSDAQPHASGSVTTSTRAAQSTTTASTVVTTTTTTRPAATVTTSGTTTTVVVVLGGSPSTRPNVATTPTTATATGSPTTLASASGAPFYGQWHEYHQLVDLRADGTGEVTSVPTYDPAVPEYVEVTSLHTQVAANGASLTMVVVSDHFERNGRTIPAPATNGYSVGDTFRAVLTPEHRLDVTTVHSATGSGGFGTLCRSDTTDDYCGA